ncbi:hypothetical protein [Stenotrophomonas sp. PD6]|uniref:hypothetical protein n=1 Tax=Stenotrophomonas sp. PD6 TaxID=3368612 RepID=UPI003B9DE68E
MKFLALFVLVLASCGCATTPRPVGHTDRQRGLPEDYFDSQQGCFAAWQDVLDDWVRVTGGVRGTLQETRRITAADERSVLSRTIQRVWRMQAYGGGHDQRSIVLQFSDALDKIGPNASLPQECTTIIWLQPLLVETPGVFSEGARDKLLEAAPSGAREDTRIFSKWLLYGILTAEP